MSTRTPSRDRLRQQWLQQAEAVFELMFDTDQQEQLVTFDQREHRAHSLANELAAWLLEEHAAARPAPPPPGSAARTLRRRLPDPPPDPHGRPRHSGARRALRRE